MVSGIRRSFGQRGQLCFHREPTELVVVVALCHAGVGGAGGVRLRGILPKHVGACVKKSTYMLHNLPHLHNLASAKPDVRKCAVVLRGQVLWQGEPVWRTALASPYPPALTKEWAKFVAEALVFRQIALDAGAPVQFASHLKITL